MVCQWAEPGLRQGRLCGQYGAVGGFGERNLVGPCGEFPPTGVGVDVRQQARVDGQGHRSGRAGFEFDAFDAATGPEDPEPVRTSGSSAGIKPKP